MRFGIWTISLVLAVGCGNLKDSTTDEEDKIIALVLQHENRKDGYSVVIPRTNLGGPGGWSEVDRKKEYLKEDAILTAMVITDLVNQLIAKNKSTVTIGLQSDQKNGYLVDLDDSFQKYWEVSRWNWERMRRERPKARSLTWVSRPAYDQGRGIVVIYLGRLRGDYDGEGYLIAYEYKEGTLKELKRVTLWIS